MLEIQRRRLLSGAQRVACDRGAGGLTVAAVISAAGVSRRTFYELFATAEECLHAAIEQALAEARDRAIAAWRAQEGPWRARVREALVALLGLFEERPELGYLLIVEWQASGSRALARRREILSQLAGVLEQGRGDGARAAQPPELAGEAVVGATVGVLHARMLDAESPRRLLELTNPLMSMIVLPYLGGAAARGELDRAVPAAPDPGRLSRTPESALGDLRIRLTRRTLAVISALAANPGASNRTIGEAAGILNQGQSSKLLTRLRRLGLVENLHAGAARKGRPNAWQLTAQGRHVVGSLRL